MKKEEQRKARALEMVKFLKNSYPTPKSELNHETPFQFVVAVMMSAQCTDKTVNRVTEQLFKKYKTPRDFARADLETLTKEISSVTFFRNKAKAIIAAAKIVEENFNGKVPESIAELTTLPGVGYKTANVVLGELFERWDGIATDTHVKRFAKRLDLTDNEDLTKISKDLERLIPKEDWQYVNNGLVLYGRYICNAREHDCSEHELTAIWPESRTRWPKVKEIKIKKAALG